MKNKILQIGLLLTALVVSVNVSAETNKDDPFKLVQAVAQELFDRIAREQKVIQEDPEQLRVVVAEELAPSINYKFAAAKVLGPHYKNTTKAQRAEFYKAFREYLIATYAGILTLYKDQQVVFEPATDVEGKRRAQVKVRVLDEGKPDIRIEFILRKNRDGEWAAYDMVAEGISVLSSKTKELQVLIRQQGIDAVTELLLEKSAKPILVKSIG